MDTKIQLEILIRIKRLQRVFKKQSIKPFTIEEASEYSGLSKSSLYKLTSSNTIAFYKPNGKKIYFLKKDLDKYLLSKRVKSTEEIEQQAIDISFNMGNKKKK